MTTTKTKALHNGMDVIDSRDVIERIAHLDSELRARHEEWQNETDDDGNPLNAEKAFDDWLTREAEEGDEDAYELCALLELQNDAERAADWKYGEALINDYYFEDYAREFASDIHGKQIQNASWPFDHIDWSAAAEALKQDYRRVSFDDQDYWIRA